jgi:hypothetical protein
MLLKTVSILLIVLGALSVAFLLHGLAYFASNGIAVLAVFCLGLLVAVLQIVIGSIGFKLCNKPAKGGFFLWAGAGLGVLCVLSLALVAVQYGIYSASTWNSVTGLILPILYLVGGIDILRSE